MFRIGLKNLNHISQIYTGGTCEKFYSITTNAVGYMHIVYAIWCIINNVSHLSLVLRNHTGAVKSSA
jgi:hypothetical protein